MGLRDLDPMGMGTETGHRRGRANSPGPDVRALRGATAAAAGGTPGAAGLQGSGTQLCPAQPGPGRRSCGAGSGRRRLPRREGGTEGAGRGSGAAAGARSEVEAETSPPGAGRAAGTKSAGAAALRGQVKGEKGMGAGREPPAPRGWSCRVVSVRLPAGAEPRPPRPGPGPGAGRLRAPRPAGTPRG